MKARASLLLSLSSAAVCALLATGLTPHPARTQDAPARSDEELRRMLAGAWFLTVTPAQGQAAIDSAIERAVSEMNFFLQGVTRTQVRENTPVNRRIDVGFADDGRITVGFDQRFVYTTRPGVAQDFALPDGSSVNVNQLFRGGHLEQVFTATLGRRWNVYTLSPDGQTMSVTATSQGPMMPVPVVFTLQYRQRPTPPG